MKIVKKPAVEKPTVEEVESVLVSGASETVSVKIKRAGEYGIWGIEILRSVQVPDGKTCEEVMDESISIIQDKIDKYITEIDFSVPEGQTPDPEANEFVSSYALPVPEPEEESGSDEEVAVTEDTIRAMSKSELITLVADEDIDVDVKKYKKAADLAQAIIDVVFAGEEAGSEEDGEEEEITEDAIREMDREELAALIEEHELDVDPKEYKKLGALIEAVIAAAFPDEEETTEGEESGEEEGVLTEDDVRAMDKEEIIALIKEESIPVNPKDYKKLADLINAVVEELFTDEESSGEGEEEDGWKDTDFDDK